MSLVHQSQKREKGWSRSRSSKAQTSVHQAVKELSRLQGVSEGESYIRGQQIKELGTIAYVLNTLCHKVTEGKLNQSDIDKLAPPRVKAGIEGGTTALYEYIRDCMVDMRGVISTLHVEVQALTRKLERVEREVAASAGFPGADDLYEPIAKLNISDLSSFLKDLDQPETEEEKLEE